MAKQVLLFSTHVVSDIEHIDNTVLMMKNGQFIYQGKWQEQQGDLEAFICSNLRRIKMKKIAPLFIYEFKRFVIGKLYG